MAGFEVVRNVGKNSPTRLSLMGGGTFVLTGPAPYVPADWPFSSQYRCERGGDGLEALLRLQEAENVNSSNGLPAQQASESR